MFKKKIFNTNEHNINKLILVLGVFLLTITALVMANSNGWIALNSGILTAFKTISIILWTYFIASIFIKLTQNKAHKLFDESVDIEQKILLSKFYTFIVYSLATAYVLWKMGVTLANITIFLGLIATGLAFALREILLPFFIWFILLTKRPFRIGDYIRIGEDEGKVRHIGTFFVFLDPINTDINETIKIPNKLFLEKQIINYGGLNLPVVLKVPITAVDLKDCSNKIKNIRTNLLKKYTEYKINPKIISEKEYVYLFFDFTVSPKENLPKIRNDIYEEVYNYFKGPR
jgi:small-conductance mechanosensitive channel